MFASPFEGEQSDLVIQHYFAIWYQNEAPSGEVTDREGIHTNSAAFIFSMSLFVLD